MFPRGAYTNPSSEDSQRWTQPATTRESPWRNQNDWERSDRDYRDHYASKGKGNNEWQEEQGKGRGKGDWQDDQGRGKGEQERPYAPEGLAAWT